MEILYDSPTTRVLIVDNGTEDVFISFNGLTGEHIKDDYAEVVVEFKSLAKTHTTIFVADKTMSWGNNVDWEEIAGVINPLIRNRNAIAVGLSMGGSNAILASSFISVKKVLAFNPQFTIYPEFHAQTTYMTEAKLIKNWRFKTIYDGFNKHTQYIICWSTKEKSDTYFLGLFPNYITNINFGDRYGHNLAGELKSEGRLQELFDLVLKDDIDGLISFSENKV